MYQDKEHLQTIPKSDEYKAIRNTLLSAGFLVTSIPIDEEEQGKILSPEEIAKIGKLSPSAPSIIELLDEDRGEY